MGIPSESVEKTEVAISVHGRKGILVIKYVSQVCFLLYRKLRRISYKAKSAPHGSHCGGTEFVASRPAAGGESCGAGFYFAV